MTARDAYPGDDDLARLRVWDMADPMGWLAYARTLWWAPERGWPSEDFSGAVHVSTGGWSGNEEIVTAMQANALWGACFLRYTAGGHYDLCLPEHHRREMEALRAARADAARWRAFRAAATVCIDEDGYIHVGLSGDWPGHCGWLTREERHTLEHNSPARDEMPGLADRWVDAILREIGP